MFIFSATFQNLSQTIKIIYAFYIPVINNISQLQMSRDEFDYSYRLIIIIYSAHTLAIITFNYAIQDNRFVDLSHARHFLFPQSGMDIQFFFSLHIFLFSFNRVLLLSWKPQTTSWRRFKDALMISCSLTSSGSRNRI